MDSAIVTFVLALAAGVLGQSVAKHLRIPGIVVLLGLGVGLGPDGLRWVEPATLGDGLFDIVELAVAIILFEGGTYLQHPVTPKVKENHAVSILNRTDCLTRLLNDKA